MTRLRAVFTSLRARFVISIALIQIATIAMLVWDSLESTRESTAIRVEETARSVVQLFADAIGQHLVSVDLVALEQFAEKALKHRDMSYVVVFDAAGRAVAQAGSIASPLPTLDATVGSTDDGVYDLAADAVLGGKARGRVQMGFNLDRLQTAVDFQRRRDMAVGLSGVLLAMVVASLIGHGLTRRLAELVRGTEAVTRGNYDVTLPVGGPDEVRRLTESYNAMLRTIQSRIHDLQFSEERFRSLVENSPDCVMSIELDGRIELMSPAGMRLLFVSAARDASGKTLRELLPPLSRDEIERSLTAARQGTVTCTTLQAYGPGGEGTWLDVVLAPVRGRDSRIVSILGVLRDVTASRAQAAALEHMSRHDLLTDLPNRSRFAEMLEKALEEAQRSGKSVAVMVMDLDRFKEVNDTLGHHIGDQMLQQVALRLRDSFGHGEGIARLGGDEFAVCMLDVSEQEAVHNGQRVIRALEQAIPLSELDIQVGTSVGIAMFPNHGRTASLLLQRADVAMYHAKRQRAGLAVYSQEIDPNSVRRLAMLGELRHAIDSDELVLQFQPKIDGRTRSCSGVEALVRWNHPQHGMMPPAEFIGLAEETGLIRPLTRWVLDAALRQCVEWQSRGYRIPVAVNLSVRNLLDPKLVDMVAAQLKRWNISPECLELEITESDIMSEPERALRVLRSLDQMGIKLAVDDFGTGYSSLAYLKRLPVDEIKIDKSFIIGMGQDDNDATIVDATIDLAHKLGLRVVAEGVEDLHTANLLDQLGCDYLQGFFISRPVAGDAFLEWLQLNKIATDAMVS